MLTVSAHQTSLLHLKVATPPEDLLSFLFLKISSYVPGLGHSEFRKDRVRKDNSKSHSKECRAAAPATVKDVTVLTASARCPACRPAQEPPFGI